MSTKKTDNTPQENKEKRSDLQVRMETGKVEIMKVVEGVPGAEKLAELIERGKKKGSLSSSELLDVLEDMDLGNDQMEKIYDTLENLGIDTAGEDYIPELPDDVEPPVEDMEEISEKPVLSDLVRKKRFERYVVLENRNHPGEIRAVFDQRGSLLCCGL